MSDCMDSNGVMKLLYPDKPILGIPSLYLAGPTPRDSNVLSWRKNAVNLLYDLDFQGTVCIPERDNWNHVDYLQQVEWEYKAMMASHKILFWVPRDMNILPGMTTNTEFGYWLALRPDNVRYGRPDNAPHTRYLDWLYQKQTGREPNSTLLETIQEVL